MNTWRNLKKKIYRLTHTGIFLSGVLLMLLTILVISGEY